MANKKALVTGASQGIGRACALALANDGIDIAILDVNEEGAAQAATEIRALGVESLSVCADVSSYEGVETAVSKILGSWGKVDILINNAGITRDKLLLRMKPDDGNMDIDINLTGA